MTFIYQNPKLLQDLVKSVLDHEKKFNKHGQLLSDPSVNVEFKNYLDLSQKLVNQLIQQYSPTSKDPNALPEVASQSEAPLGVPELTTLGNFLDFTVQNGITVDGQRVVYGSHETPPDPRKWLPVDAEQSKLMLETTTPEGERVAPQGAYYVNKDLLTKYINSLLASMSQEDDQTQKFIKAMMSGIISRVNNIFRTKLTTEYKPPVEALPHDTIVDTVPPVLDTKQWGQLGREGLQLSVGDLQSPETLNAWFKRLNVGVKSGDGKPATIDDQDFNSCAGISVLYNRAQALLRRATPETKVAATIYFRQIAQIASQMHCDISQLGATSLPADKTTAPGQGRVSPNALAYLADMLPFNSEEINPSELKMFVDNFAQLENTDAVNTLAQQANEAFRKINTLMQSPGAPIQMDETTLSPAGFKLLTKNPQQLVSVLYNMISIVGRMYELFVRNHLQEIANPKSSMGPQVARSVERQIAAGGPQRTNLGNLLQLLNDLKEDFQQGYRR